MSNISVGVGEQVRAARQGCTYVGAIIHTEHKQTNKGINIRAENINIDPNS